MKFASKHTVSVTYTERIVSEDAGLYGRWIASFGDSPTDTVVVIESFFGMFLVYDTTVAGLKALMADKERLATWSVPQKMAWSFYSRLNTYGLSRTDLFDAVRRFRAHTPAERRQLIEA